MLTVEGLQTSYGQSQVLFGVDLEVRRGEVVTLLGRNGMGKTTTIRSIMGMTPPHGGRITFEGQELRGLTSFRIAKLGLGLVPEGRCIFPSLTVWENLTATSAAGPRGQPRWSTDTILDLFPWIACPTASNGRTAFGRRAADAGDRARADDQPGAVDPGRGDRRACSALSAARSGKCCASSRLSGQSILLVDKNVKVLARLADRHYVLERGRVRWSGDSRALGNEYEVIRRFVGL